MISQIDKYLDAPQRMGAESLATLQELIGRYPFCAAFRILRIMALGNVRSTQMPAAIQETAVFVPDRFQLFTLTNQGEYEWVVLHKQIREKRMRQTPPAENDFLLIDRYLEQKCLPATTLPLYDATDALSRLKDIKEAVADDDGSAPPETADTGNDRDDDEQDALIDSFIEAERQGTLFVPSVPLEEETADEDSGKSRPERALLTENLAKIYIKQHKYEQALAIIRDLSLKYPKKNVYFADQIRFLEKMIAYQSNKNN